MEALAEALLSVAPADRVYDAPHRAWAAAAWAALERRGFTVAGLSPAGPEELREGLREHIDTLDAAGFDVHGAHAPAESWLLCEDQRCLRIKAALKALTAALATPAPDTGAGPLKWWLLADIAHARNESIADVGGHCNHDESPPECIGEAQETARAYNALVNASPRLGMNPRWTEAMGYEEGFEAGLKAATPAPDSQWSEGHRAGWNDAKATTPVPDTGGHTWAEHIDCDATSCTVAHLARSAPDSGAEERLRAALSGDSILGVAGQIRLFASECERQRPGQFPGWVSTWREWADAIDTALSGGSVDEEGG